MKKFNLLIVTSAIALLATGCVKPTQDVQPIYDSTAPSTTTTPSTTEVLYEEAQPIVYEPAVGTSTGTVYEEVQPEGTVITTGGYDQVVTADTGPTYPDPYANGGTGTVYNDPYAAGQQVISDYPATAPASSSSSAPVGQGGGIHLQIAALKDYYTAEDYKNRLSLAPGMSAYVKRGAMNKVIVSGIPSIAEANRLKESRFPGAFIVQGGSSWGYTPAVQPNYETTNNGGGYSVNNPYGVSSSSGTLSSASGVGVQVGAFGSMSKAQSVADSQGGQYPAIVKKIGRYYKVILTGFSSRSAAKAYSGRVGGFVVNY